LSSSHVFLTSMFPPFLRPLRTALLVRQELSMLPFILQRQLTESLFDRPRRVSLSCYKCE
ncbi:MAG: hypothetical protein NC415_04960, partial [bacterium]|nr:hypothetical protein [bacterium]